MKSTIHLTKSEVGNIIKEYFESQGYVGISDISFDIGQECEGYGAMESYSYVFRGANVGVDVQPIIKKK